MFYKIVAPENFVMYKKTPLPKSLFELKKGLWLRLKYVRTPFLLNTSGRKKRTIFYQKALKLWIVSEIVLGEIKIYYLRNFIVIVFQGINP